jgi:hypothetical protein
VLRRACGSTWGLITSLSSVDPALRYKAAEAVMFLGCGSPEAERQGNGLSCYAGKTRGAYETPIELASHMRLRLEGGLT